MQPQPTQQAPQDPPVGAMHPRVETTAVSKVKGRELCLCKVGMATVAESSVVSVHLPVCKQESDGLKSIVSTL